MALSKTVTKKITSVAETRAKKVESKRPTGVMNSPKSRKPLNKGKP